ncbi:MAG: hypothetical protein A3F54_05865 [Candidatus Kerfeldbacteria bacterium RIFCSPHIGHO2_12_FULL_48_17]|uniref:Nudix hydrolase domain-containing protein n=1 Tax=Candidatus Kerfeldbacteria bacterium RIFCSPHIGHO2_12_FULL_48_17 TaxID=1798542 RepID=A0A1G2B1C5_9BACT|nr:MAG: hypothetical protein A3F54_05865 [Candidatus Kerfeldbacteria bacterium RIFCSPHIGHO2_12_FULL_48_17]
MQLQVGVKAILRNEEGKILLLRRSQAKYPDVKGDVWDIVGGRIEPGTPLLDNLRREIREETGLQLQGVPKLIAAQDILKNPEKHVVRLTYIAEVAAGDVRLDDDHEAYQWYTSDELRTLPGLDRYFTEVLAAVGPAAKGK